MFIGHIEKHLNIYRLLYLNVYILHIESEHLNKNLYYNHNFESYTLQGNVHSNLSESLGG